MRILTGGYSDKMTFNNLILIFSGLIFIASTIACSRDGKFVSRESSGGEVMYYFNEDAASIASVGLMNENGKQGEWVIFDSGGKISKTETYLNGVLDGPVVEFLCCKKFSTYTFDNGVLEGEIIYYSSEGYVSSRGNFKNGKLNGVWIDFIDGEILSISKHEDDKQTTVFENPRHKNAIVGKEVFGCCPRESGE